VEELLEGRIIDMPPIRQVSTTFKKAPRAKAKPVTPTSLFSAPTKDDSDPDEEPPF
jgi:hypothetical protein